MSESREDASLTFSLWILWTPLLEQWWFYEVLLDHVLSESCILIKISFAIKAGKIVNVFNFKDEANKAREVWTLKGT